VVNRYEDASSDAYNEEVASLKFSLGSWHNHVSYLYILYWIYSSKWWLPPFETRREHSHRFWVPTETTLCHQPNCKAVEHDRCPPLQCQRHWQQQNISVWMSLSQKLRSTIPGCWTRRANRQRFSFLNGGPFISWISLCISKLYYSGLPNDFVSIVDPGDIAEVKAGLSFPFSAADWPL